MKNNIKYIKTLVIATGICLLAGCSKEEVKQALNKQQNITVAVNSDIPENMDTPNKTQNNQEIHPFHKKYTYPISEEDSKALREASREDFEKHHPAKEAYKQMGFSDRAAELMATKDMTKTITISDYEDAQLRKNMEMELKKRRETGYSTADKGEVEKIYEAINNIYDTSQDYKHLSFSPTPIDALLSDNYIYKGYKFSSSHHNYPESFKRGWVARIFTKDNSILIVGEAPMMNGEDFRIEEFVTHRIHGYPAIVEKVRSEESDKYAYKLTLSNKKYSYSLYMINNNIDDQLAKEELIKIANNLADAQEKTLSSVEEMIINRHRPENHD